MRSVVVLRQGHLAFEYHRAPWTATSLHDTQSVTKSVLGILTGAWRWPTAPSSGWISRWPIAPARTGAATPIRAPRSCAFAPADHDRRLGRPADQPARPRRRPSLAHAPPLRGRARRSSPMTTAPPTCWRWRLSACWASRCRLCARAAVRAAGRPPLRVDREGGHGHDLGALGLRLSTRDMALIGQLAHAAGRALGRPATAAARDCPCPGRQDARRPAGGHGLRLSVVECVHRARTTGGAAAPSWPAAGGQWIWVYPPLDLVVAAASSVTESQQRATRPCADPQGHRAGRARRLAAELAQAPDTSSLTSRSNDHVPYTFARPQARPSRRATPERKPRSRPWPLK